MPKVVRGGKRIEGGKYHKHNVDLAYGDEYNTIVEFEDLNVKVITNKMKDGASFPLDTATPNRIYAIPYNNDPKNELKSFAFYDKEGRRYKQIDKDNHKINGKKENPHTHYGYYHNEKGDSKVNKKDLKMIEKIEKRWYNYLSKK